MLRIWFVGYESKDIDVDLSNNPLLVHSMCIYISNTLQTLYLDILKDNKSKNQRIESRSTVDFHTILLSLLLSRSPII